MAPSSARQHLIIPAPSTVIVETPSSSSSGQQQQQQQPQKKITDSLVLKLKRPKKKVSWKEGTVDNELMNKKSSKKCCIFHKDKPFDEDDSDAEGDCDHDHKNGSKIDDANNKHVHDGDGNCGGDL